MERFQVIIKRHFYFSLIFFGAGLVFGFVYSLNLLGYILPSNILEPQNIRSVHISLMLYGFIPLMLSYLPFLLMVKDIGYDERSIRYLEIYTFIWYVFLIVMVISLLFLDPSTVCARLLIISAIIVFLPLCYKNFFNLCSFNI